CSANFGLYSQFPATRLVWIDSDQLRRSPVRLAFVRTWLRRALRFELQLYRSGQNTGFCPGRNIQPPLPPPEVEPRLRRIRAAPARADPQLVSIASLFAAPPPPAKVPASVRSPGVVRFSSGNLAFPFPAPPDPAAD